MISIDIERLSKCYKIGKKKKVNLEGLERLVHLLGINKDKNSKKKLQREIWALKDVSFSVNQGQVLGIIGRNGAGKSTLLKLLARTTTPTSGRAIIRGRVVSLLELGTGIDPAMTGRENIFLNAAFYGVKRREVMQRLDDIISFAELEQFIDTPVKHYSSGMYLRLAFSMAINMNPNVLLADEVLAVGDISFQNRCLERMKQFGQAGVTVLFVSHDMEAIQRMCDSCIWLDQGKIVVSGLPEDVVNSYQNDVFRLSQDLTVNSFKNQINTLINDYGELISVKLLSEKKQEIGAVKVSQDTFVEVKFRMFTAAQVFCVLDVSCDGIRVFRSVQPQELDSQASEDYEAVVCIPKYLLAEKNYSVTAIICIRVNGEENPLVFDNALSFQVYDTGETISARGAFTGRMPGVVSPLLAWSLSKR